MELLKFQSSDLKLLFNLFKIGLKDRFLGSFLGIIWSIANPILMLSIFTFVFGYIFQTTLPGYDGSISYIIWLISGYGPWLAISDGISSGTVAVTSNSALVKNLPFKTELLPISYSLLGLIPLLVSAVYLMFLIFISGNEIYVSIIYLLPLIVFQLLFIGGIALFLSCINVFVRDTAMVLPNILLIILFASPIFYPVNSLPSIMQSIVKINPIYIFADSYRLIILDGATLSIKRLLFLSVVSVAVFLTGLVFFRRFKTYFDSHI